MQFEYDQTKNARNVALRGLSFDLVGEFDWGLALVIEDLRRNYGEPRFRALGYIGDRLYAIAFTPRQGGIRVISLRKANTREEKGYAEGT